jgi:hypothetical protein
MFDSMLVLAQQGGEFGPAAVIFLLFQLAVAVLLVASIWVIFTKAGEPGWIALIPIVNLVWLLKITNQPLWMIILFLIPLVNLVAALYVFVKLAERFGKGPLFGVGIFFLGIIFLPLLAFGDAQYQPAAG